MKRFIESDDRMQGTLFPEYLEDYVAEDNPVRVVDVFVEHLDLGKLGFNRAEPAITGRPSYHPSVLLKLYIWLPQPDPVQPPFGERNPAQCRTDVVARPVNARL